MKHDPECYAVNENTRPLLAAGLVDMVLQAYPEQSRREQQNGTIGGGVLYSVRIKSVLSEIQTSRVFQGTED
jgi:hypothetical protein